MLCALPTNELELPVVANELPVLAALEPEVDPPDPQFCPIRKKEQQTLRIRENSNFIIFDLLLFS